MFSRQFVVLLVLIVDLREWSYTTSSMLFSSAPEALHLFSRPSHTGPTVFCPTLVDTSVRLFHLEVPPLFLLTCLTVQAAYPDSVFLQMMHSWTFVSTPVHRLEVGESALVVCIALLPFPSVQSHLPKRQLFIQHVNVSAGFDGGNRVCNKTFPNLMEALPAETLPSSLLRWSLSSWIAELRCRGHICGQTVDSAFGLFDLVAVSWLLSLMPISQSLTSSR